MNLAGVTDPLESSGRGTPRVGLRAGQPGRSIAALWQPYSAVAVGNHLGHRCQTGALFRWAVLSGALLACSLCGTVAWAGQAGGVRPPSAAQDAGKPKQEPAKPSKPAVKVESVELTTKDGFPLRATWYEGHLGKSAAPLLMLHDVGGSRQDFVRIAAYFADNGHCVLAPDWRGHGDSRLDAAGRPYQLRRYGPAEALMVQADIEACKKFLIQKNDAEVCNIELMAIVAAGAAGIPALQWSVVDWSYLPAAVKQGQDVKAVVLLSPPRTHQLWQMAPALRAPLIAGLGHPQPLELMFVVGEKSDVSRDVRSMYQQLAGRRGRRDEADDWTKHNVYLLTTETDHRGVDLVLQNPRVVPDQLFDFLELRVFNRAEEYGHHKRSGATPPPPPPLEGGQ